MSRKLLFVPFIIIALLVGCTLAGSSPVSAQETTAAEKEESETEPADTSSVVVVMETPDSLRVRADTTETVDQHPQDSPEDRGFSIITSDGKAWLRLRGSIRLNGAYDFNGLQNRDLFSTYEIPIGDANKTEPRFFMRANQTRFGLEASRGTSLGDVYMRLEGDFLGTGNRFRIRHAYGSVKRVLAGQTWSTFGDPSSIPPTVDLDGPNSSVTLRTVQVRYTRDVSDGFRWALGFESPEPDINDPDSLETDDAFQSFPDVALRLRKKGAAGHLQLAGIGRSITVRNIEGNLDYLFGYGGLLSGQIKLRDKNKLLFQLVGGSGISQFITALADRQLDVVYNPNTGGFDKVTSMGGFVSYGYAWKTDVSSYITFGLIDVRNKDYDPPDAFNTSQYISINSFWEITDGTRTGLEYSWGRRENKDGQDGTANRISFVMYYDF
jgi:hypothetical protein